MFLKAQKVRGARTNGNVLSGRQQTARYDASGIKRTSFRPGDHLSQIIRRWRNHSHGDVRHRKRLLALAKHPSESVRISTVVANNACKPETRETARESFGSMFCAFRCELRSVNVGSPFDSVCHGTFVKNATGHRNTDFTSRLWLFL